MAEQKVFRICESPSVAYDDYGAEIHRYLKFIGDRNEAIRKLNEEGWRVDQITQTYKDKSDYLDLLCTKDTPQ